MNYAVMQRLRLIDFLLGHYGSLGREELMDYFGIGPAQATRDFAVYAKEAPGNAVLNMKTKRWEITNDFDPLFS